MRIAAIIVIFMFALLQRSAAQNVSTDLQLVSNAKFYSAEEFSYYHGALNSKKSLETHNNNVVANYNPVALVLKGSMLLYQNVLSPQLSKDCPYEITCSNYAKLAIKQYGAMRGVIMGAERIMRCNRIAVLDVDPLSINEFTGKITDPPSKYQ